MKQYLSSVFFVTGNCFSVTQETLREDAPSTSFSKRVLSHLQESTF